MHPLRTFIEILLHMTCVLHSLSSGTGTFIIQLMQNRPSTDAILIDPYIPENNLYPTITLNTHMHFLRVRAESFINVQHPDYAWRDRKWWQRGYHQVL